MSDVTSVLIADDHDIVRDAVAHVIGTALSVPVQTARDKQTALQAIAGHGPFSVLLLDIAMPGMSGSSVQEMVKANAPGAVVVFSGLVDAVFVRQAVLQGARGYIPKTLPLTALCGALKRVAAGEVFLPLPKAEPPPTGQPAPRLSEKELSVLRLLVKGQTNKEIAKALGSTELRIKMHLRSIYARLGARNRTQAALIAEQGGLIDQG